MMWWKPFFVTEIFDSMDPTSCQKDTGTPFAIGSSTSKIHPQLFSTRVRTGQPYEASFSTDVIFVPHKTRHHEARCSCRPCLVSVSLRQWSPIMLWLGEVFVKCCSRSRVFMGVVFTGRGKMRILGSFSGAVVFGSCLLETCESMARCIPIPYLLAECAGAAYYPW